jgi:hypothetical protein
MNQTDQNAGESNKPQLVINPKGNFAQQVFDYSCAVGDTKMDKAIAERQKQIRAKKAKAENSSKAK